MQLAPMDTDIIHYFRAKKDFSQRLKVFMDQSSDKPYSKLIKLAASFRPPLERGPRPTKQQKLHNSCRKRVGSIQFHTRKFLYGKDWHKDAEGSRKLAPKHRYYGFLHTPAHFQKLTMQFRNSHNSEVHPSIASLAYHTDTQIKTDIIKQKHIQQVKAFASPYG